MIVNARVFVLIALITYGVCAHTVDIREPYKKTNDKKYAGSMLVEIAKELVQRSTTSSQVIKIMHHYIKKLRKYNQLLTIKCVKNKRKIMFFQ